MSHPTSPYAELLRRSRDIIVSHQAPSGAYPACEEFSAYRGYSWFRDGSFIADAMSRVGEAGSADRFHAWCVGVLRENEAKVHDLIATFRAGETPEPGAMLPTRFTFDGQPGSDPWWDFQLDGYGTWLWAVHAHAARHDASLEPWADGVRVAVDYLVEFWDLSCYDWWEEHVEHRHGSTLGAIFAGLDAAATSSALNDERRVAARQAADAIRATLLDEGTTADGHLRKWMGSDAVDGSLTACVVPFGVVAPGSPVAEATLAAVEEQITVDGGVHRFAADVFFGGGQWPLLSCLLGWNHLAAGRRDRAEELLSWAAAQADADLQLPEQVPHDLLHPEHRQEWLDRWGPVAQPLLWSHAMVLTLAHELGHTTEEVAR